MKVLILSKRDSGGGAEIAAFRLCESLNKHGIDATLGVVEKKTDSPFVLVLPEKKRLAKPFGIIIKLINFVKRLFYTIFIANLFPFLKKYFNFYSENAMGNCTNFKSIIDVNWINNSDYDLINFHWVYGDMISIKDMGKINKPIVWTMHDSWACCGSELHPHILENDTRYQNVYTKKNRVKSEHGPDLSKKTWKLKQKYLKNKNIIFITPSNWQHDILKSSMLFKKNECYVIPNVFPKDIFCPRNKAEIRKTFNFPQNKKIIGFGAAGGLDNPKSLKGYPKLLEALDYLENKDDYFLIIYGQPGASFTSRISIPYFASGFISNPFIMSLLYNACDVITNPSLIENLPNVCMEAMFCGVPVTAFNTGGTSDVIEHKKTGYLANCFDAKDFANGIEFCFKNKATLGENALKRASYVFEESTAIHKYIECYEKALRQFSEITYKCKSKN